MDTQHLYDEDGLFYETTCVVVRMGIKVEYLRLVTSSGDNKPLKKVTPVHIANGVCMSVTVTLQPLHHPSPVDDSVQLNPDRRIDAQSVQPQLPRVLGWNSQGRLATENLMKIAVNFFS